MEVKGIEVWAVQWPDELSPSADDSALEFFCEEWLSNIGAVRRNSILRPPEDFPECAWANANKGCGFPEKEGRNFGQDILHLFHPCVGSSWSLFKDAVVQQIHVSQTSY